MEIGRLQGQIDTAAEVNKALQASNLPPGAVGASGLVARHSLNRASTIHCVVHGR